MEALKDAIRRDGFLCPIIVRRKRGKYEILAGNHRWMAASELGHKEIPAVIVKVDDKQAQRIAVNTNTVHGEPTAELLAPFLAEMDDDILASTFLSDDLSRELQAFDETLAARLSILDVPDKINTASSTSPIERCRCPKCGKDHLKPQA
jgi:ParB family chromosome partitioning protein